MRARIILVLSFEGGEKKIPVGEGEGWDSFLIGRCAEADLFLNDPAVSRRHCRIFRRPRSIAIEDLGSRAGTLRNGEKVRRAISLQSGDAIQVGGVRLVVRIEAPPGRTSERRATAPRAASTPPPPGGGEVEETIVSRGGPAPRPVAGAEVLSVRLEGGAATILGRDPSCEACLRHPTISRRHAEIVTTAGGMLVRDLGSTNGTFLNGRRVSAESPLKAGDELRIGPYALAFDGQRLVSHPGGTRIAVAGLGKQVNDRETGKPIWILRDINLTIEPREFVGLLGSSGCGKSTFMDAVNGRRPATDGAVLYNGENLYNRFDAFKKGIGYVPQELIFHQHLPLHDALVYASRLRLPDDTSAEEIEENIGRVLETVGLSERRATTIANLSGGQKKRVSIAMELLSRPTLLFLDEATSGLDLGTEGQMMRLFRGLADGGVTTLCITHFVDSLEMCDMVAYFVRGRLAYYGPPAELKSYFGVEAIRDVYLAESEKEPERWEEEFRRSPAHERFVAARAEPEESCEQTRVRPGQAIEVARPSNPRRQLGVLTRRYVQILLGDRRALLLQLGLAPLIGLLVSIVLSGGGHETIWKLASRQGQLCFTLTLVMFFLGIFGAIREIVKELPIYRHERFVNLEVLPYLASKALPLAAIVALQTIELLIVVHLFADMRANIVGQFCFLFPSAVAAMLLGLAISAAVDTADKAILIMVVAVIPQLLFANAFIALQGLGSILGKLFILAYWCNDALKNLLPAEVLNLRNVTTGKLALHGTHGWLLDLLMILVFGAIYGALAWYFLRCKDGPRGRPHAIPWVRSGAWVELRARALSAAARGYESLADGVREMVRNITSGQGRKPGEKP